jgi:hypothetical protein
MRPAPLDQPTVKGPKLVKSPVKHALYRAFGAFLMIAGLLLGSQGAALAQSSDPGLISSTAYESPIYTFAMSWKDPWSYVPGSAKSGQADEITLQSATGYLSVYIVPAGNFSQQGLLDEVLRKVQSESSNYQEVARGEERDFISVTVQYINPSGVSVKHYVEVNVITARDGYEALSAVSLRSAVNNFDNDWASIDKNILRDGTDFVFRGLSNGDTRPGDIRGPNDEPKKPKVKGGTFSGGMYDYKVTWDSKIWDGDRLDPPTGVEGYEGVNLNSATSEGWIEIFALFGGDPAGCVADWGEHLQSLTSISSFREAPEAALPKTGKGVVATLFAYTFTSKDGEVFELVEYTECRVVVEGTAVMRVTFVAPIADYESLIPGWEDVLKGIDITTG